MNVFFLGRVETFSCKDVKCFFCTLKMLYKGRSQKRKKWCWEIGKRTQTGFQLNKFGHLNNKKKHFERAEHISNRVCSVELPSALCFDQ